MEATKRDQWTFLMVQGHSEVVKEKEVWDMLLLERDVVKELTHTLDSVWAFEGMLKCLIMVFLLGGD